MTEFVNTLFFVGLMIEGCFMAACELVVAVFARMFRKHHA